MTSQETLYFLQSLRALSRYHQALGIEQYPAGAKLPALDKLPRPGKYTKNESAASETPQPRPFAPGPAPRREQLPPTDTAPAASIALPDLRNCRLCAAGEIQPLTARAGRMDSEGEATASPQLFVVGDYSHGADFDDAFLFGKEEDELLSRMLAAISLGDADVAITNLVKCRPAAEPGDVVAERCLAHLRRQMFAARPRLILAMGALPARLLVAKNASLSALRGRLHNFFPQEGRPVPVLVSYHPTFLLAQTEMKKAAWEDLKMAQRFLASVPLAARSAE
jgi:DNA polymerase